MEVRDGLEGADMDRDAETSFRSLACEAEFYREVYTHWEGVGFDYTCRKLAPARRPIFGGLMSGIDLCRWS